MYIRPSSATNSRTPQWVSLFFFLLVSLNNIGYWMWSRAVGIRKDIRWIDSLTDYHISAFFRVSQNLSCSFLQFKKFLTQNNTGYNFCVCNNLIKIIWFKRDHEKKAKIRSSPKIIGYANHLISKFRKI